MGDKRRHPYFDPWAYSVNVVERKNSFELRTYRWEVTVTNTDCTSVVGVDVGVGCVGIGGQPQQPERSKERAVFVRFVTSFACTAGASIAEGTRRADGTTRRHCLLLLLMIGL